MTAAISNFAVDVVDRHAREPDRIALRWQTAGGFTTDVTFQDMKIRSEKVAYVLHHHGVRPGQRVFILLPLCTAWWGVLCSVACAQAPWPYWARTRPRHRC